MGASTSFLQVATVANALIWPLAAGAAVVAWTKLRAAAHARRVAAASRRLDDFYEALEAPTGLACGEELQEAKQAAPAAAAHPRRETPADP